MSDAVEKFAERVEFMERLGTISEADAVMVANVSPAVVKLFRAVEAQHHVLFERPGPPFSEPSSCRACGDEWPCPEAEALAEFNRAMEEQP